VKYKLLTFNAYASAAEKPHLRLNDDEDVLNTFLCSKSSNDRFHKLDCTKRACDFCNDQKEAVKEHYQSMSSNKPIKWNHWERVSEGGKTRKRLLVKKI
jgi:hypothetical protein